MGILDRILEVADYKGIKISALERSIGASEGVIRHAIRKKTDIQGKWLSKISENYPDISPEWLLTGRGNMVIGTPGPKDDLHTLGQVVSNLSEALKEANHTIAFLKEEIKNLRKELDQERRKMGLPAGDVDNDTTANAQIG